MAEDLPCRDWDPELFFPVRGSGFRPGTVVYEDYHWQVQTAKSVCAGCHLRTECLERGLDEPIGIWGGLTEEERAQLRPARRPGRPRKVAA